MTLQADERQLYTCAEHFNEAGNAETFNLIYIK